MLSRLVYCIVSSSALLGVGQAAVAQNEQVTIVQGTLKGFSGPHLSADVKVRDNRVIIKHFDTTLQFYDFDETDHSITDKQPYVNVTTDKDGLVIHAGRKGSYTPADWLRNQGFPLIRTNPTDPSTWKPRELNFAVVGDLTLMAQNANVYDNSTYTGSLYSGRLVCKNVAFAQGSSAAQLGENNWWMYSNLRSSGNDGGMSDVYGSKLTVECEGDGGGMYVVDFIDTSWEAFGMLKLSRGSK
jgi:hypothetical protein